MYWGSVTTPLQILQQENFQPQPQPDVPWMDPLGGLHKQLLEANECSLKRDHVKGKNVIFQRSSFTDIHVKRK